MTDPSPGASSPRRSRVPSLATHVCGSRCEIARAISLALAAVFAMLAPVAWPRAAHAGEGPVWLASGPAGGTYRAVYGANLATQLRGYDVFFRDTAGSDENLKLLLEGQADIGFVQGDVYALAHEKSPEVARDLQLIGRLADECVYVARREGGRIQAFEDLKAPADGTPARVAVGPAEGGPAGTWRWLSEVDPALAATTVDHQGSTLALNQLAVGRFDAVVWVTDPNNLQHKMLQALNANSALGLVPVKDERLLEPLSDGTVVYRKKKVRLTGGWPAKKVETICTSALVLMRRDADAALVARVSDEIGLHLDAIVPPPTND